MKKLQLLLINMVLLCSLTKLLAMEKQREEYKFLKSSIDDIQNYARDLTEETGRKYAIVKKSPMVVRYLEVLGLTTNNTPLDVKYHYNLLKQKLSKDEPAYNLVKKAYNELINMLSVFDDYSIDLHALVIMNFKQAEAMELKNVGDQYKFIKDKDQLIKNTIKVLQKSQRQHVAKKPYTALISLESLLDISADASRDEIESAYNRYMENNSVNRLIALKNMNRISNDSLKSKMREIEKVKQAYMQYLREIHPFK